MTLTEIIWMSTEIEVTVEDVIDSLRLTARSIRSEIGEFEGDERAKWEAVAVYLESTVAILNKEVSNGES